MKRMAQRAVGMACAAAALACGLGVVAHPANAADKKFKIFLSMSYIGNDWPCLLYTSPSPRDTR